MHLILEDCTLFKRPYLQITFFFSHQMFSKIVNETVESADHPWPNLSVTPYARGSMVV